MFRAGRVKLIDHYLDNAFKSGMVSEEIRIVSDDTSLCWRNRNSKREGIRQSKLLGYWTTTNFASLGKVFFEDSWEASKGNFVTVESGNNTRTITAAEIDEIILPKMKCSVIELNVCESTLSNLKHFVTVPIDEIEVYNALQLTRKMRFFDIRKDYVEKCWTALKRGKWQGNRQVRNKNCFST